MPATPSAAKNSSTAEDRKAMRSTFMVRVRNSWLAISTLSISSRLRPSRLKVKMPRRRSAKKPDRRKVACC